MSFKKIIIYSFIATLSIFNLHAENHDTEQNIIDKAKEINQQIKQKQANSQNNIATEINEEEPLPLNDPFVGDSSFTGGTQIIADPEEAKNKMSLYEQT